jgi:hypothetical protein
VSRVPSHDDDFDPRRFIAGVDWIFAKTMAHYNPHEYVVERVEGGNDFTAFVAFVRSGPIRRYRGGRYHCVTVDDHDYFLTHAGDAGWIVNRKPTATAGWDAEPPPTHDPREVVWHDVERELITRAQAETKLRVRGSEPEDER